MGINMKIERRTDWIAPKEKLISVEIGDPKARYYYSYTYVIGGEEECKPLVRWDNFNKTPHVDVYSDGTVKRFESPEKDYTEVLKVVRLFRSNLCRMDLATL
jgi:hypothetical protein